MRETSADTPKAITERFLEAMSRLDTEAMFDELAPDVTCEFPACPAGAPREFCDRDSIKQFFSTMIRPMWIAFSLTHIEVHALVGDQQQVVANYASEGLLVDGSPYHNTYLSMFRVRHGKIELWREYFDPAPLACGVAALQAHVSAP